jgi:hypothetical protein
MTTPDSESTTRKESERDFAIRLANKVLDVLWADPDDDLRTLARQFLREISRGQASRQQTLREVVGKMKSEVRIATTADGSFVSTQDFVDLLEALEKEGKK